MDARRARRSFVTTGQTEQPVGQGHRHRPDYWLVILVLSMLAIGLIVVYAISPALAQAAHVSDNYFVTKQFLAIALSVVAFTVTSRVPLRYWRAAYKPLLVVSALVTLVALVMPVNPEFPAHRWIRLGSLSFQPVELLKFAILIWLAGMLSERISTRQIADTKQTLKPLLVAFAIVGIVVAFRQSDLGSTGVIVAMMATMAYVAGMPLRKLC